jgi:hypothetical protein
MKSLQKARCSQSLFTDPCCPRFRELTHAGILDGELASQLIVITF